MQFYYSMAIEEKPIIDRVIRLIRGKITNIKDPDKISYAVLSLDLRENTVNLSLMVQTCELEWERIMLANYSNWLTEDFYVTNSENLRKCFEIVKLAKIHNYKYTCVIRPGSLSYKDAEYCFGCANLDLETKIWQPLRQAMIPYDGIDVLTYGYSVKFGNTDKKPDVHISFREKGVYAFVKRRDVSEDFASQIVGAISRVIHYSIMYGHQPHPLIECMK